MKMKLSDDDIDILEQIAKDMLKVSLKLSVVYGDDALSTILDKHYLCLQKILKKDSVNTDKSIIGIFSENTDNLYGVVGTYAGYGDYQVGDIVQIDRYKKAIICYKNGEAFPFGWRGNTMPEYENKYSMKILKKYNEVTEKDLESILPSGVLYYKQI